MDASEFEDISQKLQSRLPLVGQRNRLTAIERLTDAAEAGHGGAARLLAEALVSHFDPRVRQAAFVGVGSLTHALAINRVCAVWRVTRNADLAALIRDKQWVATKPAGLRVLTALLSDATRAIEDDDPRLAFALLEACNDRDLAIVRRACGALTELGHSGLQQAVCALVTSRAVAPEAMSAVVKGGYVPQDAADRTLFFLVTGQYNLFSGMPNCTQLLQEPYDRLGADVKSRVCKQLRQTQRIEWVTWLCARGRVEQGLITDEEWRVLYDVVRASNALEHLWRLAHICPPEMSADILGLLHDRQVVLTSEADRERFSLLYSVRPKQPAEARLYLARAEVQSTLRTGMAMIGPPHEHARIATLGFSGNSRTVLSGGTELQRHDAWSGEMLANLAIEEGQPCANVRVVDVSAKDPHVAAVEDVVVHGRLHSRVWLWEGAATPLLLEGDRFVTDLRFSGDGRLLAAAGEEETRIWDVGNIDRNTGLPSSTSSTVGPASRHLVCCLKGAAGCIRWWPRSDLIASGGAEGHVCLWDIADGRLRRQLVAKAPPITQLLIAHEGQSVATLHDDGSGRLWSAKEATCTSVLRHASGVHALAFSPDGSLLATGTGDGSLRMWEIDPFKLHATLQRADRPPTQQRSLPESSPCDVRALAFTPDGRRLATIQNGDDAISIWSTSSRRCLMRCAADAERGQAVANPTEICFSPNGHLLAARAGARVHIWRLTHARPFGAMTVDDRRLCLHMANEVIETVDVRAWKYAAAILEGRLGQ